MKKILFVFFLMVFFTSGCTSGQNNLSVNEKNAPDTMNDSSQNDVMKRINDLKNGATPKVKTTGKTDVPVPPKSPEPLNSFTNSINETTKNMNTAVIKTTKGTIKIKLNAEKAPISVENFKKYVASGFYSGTIFHRVIPGFMIQGGGFKEDSSQKDVEAPIKIESDNGLKNDRGTIAMARTMVPDSATSQFFINLKDNDMLNYTASNAQGYGYAVFGEVTEGLDVVDAIEKVKTGANGPHQDWPEENVVIESITLEE